VSARAAAAPIRALQFRIANLVYGPGDRTSPYTWIGDERIAIGSLPTPSTLPVLAREGVTHVVNCRATAQTLFSQDLAAERALFGRERVAHAPMWDHGRDQPARKWSDAALMAARALQDDPHARVLIHCQRGRRRSVLVAYAVLRLRGHTAEGAARTILSHRREGRLVPAYRRSVEAWLARLRPPEGVS
jgi:protein-tyrosine phosphatase